MKPVDDSGSLVGETRNLSPGGMFVNVVPTPQLGQEVVCELPGHEAVRGRVVWVSMPPDLADHGVGIEFVDLSKRSDGPTYAGVDLAGSLDFLEAGVELQIGASDDGRSLTARIAHVEMHDDDGPPRLSLSLVLQPEPQPESWFPDIDIDVPPSAGTRVATPIATRSVESAYVDELADHTERTVVEESGTPESRPATRPFWPFAAVAGVVLIGLVVMLAGSPAPALAPAPAAGAAAAPALAPAPAPAPAPAVEAPAPVVAPAAAAEPLATAPAAVIAATTPVVATPVKAPVKSPVVADGPWHPAVTELGGRAAVIVPLGGKTDGMTHFDLDRPQGIAINLPHARAATPLKSWLLHHPAFDSLWIRAMPTGGLQVRLHVHNGVKVKAELEDGALRIVRQ